MKGTIKRLWHKLTHLCVTWHRASAAPACRKDKTKQGCWWKEPTELAQMQVLGLGVLLNVASSKKLLQCCMKTKSKPPNKSSR